MKVKPEFKKSLSNIEEAGNLNYCFQCSSCIAECPAALIRPDFNPREIVLAVLLGITEPLVKKDSVIWECTTCYKCYEICPQGTHPIEVINALKNFAYKVGSAPDEIVKARETILDNGLLIPLSDAIEKRRKELGLPLVKKHEEFRKFLE